jgi:hypothetical protein
MNVNFYEKDQVKTSIPAILIIRWMARILGSISLVFLLVMLGTTLLASLTGKGEPFGRFHSITEMLSFLFFPLSTIAGLGLAWKWDGPGGLVVIAGIIGFHLLRPDLSFSWLPDGLAVPGLLFLLYWYLDKKRS